MTTRHHGGIHTPGHGRRIPYVATCPTTGKKGLRDRATAKRLARDLGDRGLAAFHCDHCHLWHVGHNGGRPRHWHRDHWS